MFCTKCGAQNADGTQFCTSCGTPLNAQQSQAQPVYQQPVQPVYPVAVAQPGKGMAVASLILGIISFFLFPVVTGTLGIILGGVAKSKGYRGGMATAGLVCGAIGLALWLLMIIALQNASAIFLSEMF